MQSSPRTSNITKPVNISLTYTISFAIAANELERYTK
jgi:hypothetical protein